jgi:hypothetical protein
MASLQASRPADGAWPPFMMPVLPLEDARCAMSAMLALPFDAVRAQYGTAVECGLLQRSMLAGRDFEHALVALERLSLGPFARQL